MCIALPTGMLVGEPKSARAGHEHCFRLDLAMPDSTGCTKYHLQEPYLARNTVCVSDQYLPYDFDCTPPAVIVAIAMSVDWAVYPPVSHRG